MKGKNTDNVAVLPGSFWAWRWQNIS